MSKYFVTGVSRGIGFAILQQVSSNPENTVVGFVRDKLATEKKIAEELPGRKNIHIVQGDLLDYASLKAAVEETSKITGGELDYVIANAAVFPPWSFFQTLGVLGNEPEKLEEDILYHIKGNVVAQIHIFNLTMPLILKGKTKKIMAVSSGQGDYATTAKYDLAIQGPYAISKGALDVAVAKFSAQYANEGVLLMSISPGFVDTGLFLTLTEAQGQIMAAEGAKFAKYNPRIKGPTTPEVAAAQMLGVLERASVDAGDGGTSVSQFGNRQWL